MSTSTPPPSSGGAPGFNYEVPKKPFYRRPLGILLIVVGVIVLFSIVGAIAGGGDSGGGDTASDSSSETKGSKPADTKKSKEAPEPEWKTVAKLSGNTNKAGPDFHLNGCDTRMTYKVQGDASSSLAAFYVMESGTKLLEDGGIPVASPTKPGPGETTIREDEGDYYIEVVAANVDWQTQVQEKC
jgi:hypothetical protein